MQALKKKTKGRAAVVAHGIPALVDAVDRGEVSISAAAAFVHDHKPTVQDVLVVKAGGSVADAVKKAADVKAKADRADARAKGATKTSGRSAKKPPVKSEPDIALAEFKFAVDHWLPLMDADTKREAVAYAIAKVPSANAEDVSPRLARMN